MYSCTIILASTSRASAHRLSGFASIGATDEDHSGATGGRGLSPTPLFKSCSAEASSPTLCKTLEPVTGPTGPALENEMMLPAVLDLRTAPWLLHGGFRAGEACRRPRQTPRVASQSAARRPRARKAGRRVGACPAHGPQSVRHK